MLFNKHLGTDGSDNGEWTGANRKRLRDCKCLQLFSHKNTLEEFLRENVFPQPRNKRFCSCECGYLRETLDDWSTTYCDLFNKSLNLENGVKALPERVPNCLKLFKGGWYK